MCPPGTTTAWKRSPSAACKSSASPRLTNFDWRRRDDECGDTGDAQRRGDLRKLDVSGRDSLRGIVEAIPPVVATDEMLAHVLLAERGGVAQEAGERLLDGLRDRRERVIARELLVREHVGVVERNDDGRVEEDGALDEIGTPGGEVEDEAASEAVPDPGGGSRESLREIGEVGLDAPRALPAGEAVAA